MSVNSSALGPVKAGGDVPEAPRVIFWVPPRGSVVVCSGIEDATQRATRFAGEHPGMMVGVYELIGYAYVAPSEPELIPVDRQSEVLAIPEMAN